jgi:DNA-directed RNA polymerase specialized sigma24 family protein
LITPLRKRTLEGTLYKRDAKVDALLAKLELLPRAELLAQCQITARNDPGYVPSECIMYFVRATRVDNSDEHFEWLYKILLSRLIRALPNPETNDGEVIRISQTKSRIRDVAFDRFTEALASDREAYSEKLDYFEVRFDGAVANLRRDAQDTAWREENRTTTIEYDPETNDPSPEVEEAAGSFDPFENLEENDYRSRLDAAIDTLPPEQIRIIQMLRQGFPVDSKDPDVVTIAKTLKKSEKTIRLQRDRALNALRAALLGESE